MNDTEKKEFEFALGYVLKLAESGRTFDQVLGYKAQKTAASDDFWSRLDEYKENGKYPDPKATRRLYERIYSKTRGKLRREADRSQAGDFSPTWQGFRNPITGKWRFPISFGSRKVNTENASMTPAQANLVSLLSKHKDIKNFRQLQGKVSGRSGDFEFLGDPTVFNSHASRFTTRGREDFKKAWRYVHGYDPTDSFVDGFASKLFGTHAGFDGAPHIFERHNTRRI